MAQDRASELGKEPLDQVEPRPVFGGEGELEAPDWSGGEPSRGFPRYVCGVIVEDELDCGACRVSGIEKLEEFDELAAAMAISDDRMDLAGQQINSGQQAERAMAFVLMITREARVDAGLGRQIR